MPYIKEKDRRELNHVLCGYFAPDTPGELNYTITALIHEYLEYKGLKYSNINEVIGVLECAKLELYRMVASPYEDRKKRENGAISILDSKTLEDVR